MTYSKETVVFWKYGEHQFVKKCQNCTFKVNFLCQKSTEFFQKKNPFKNINLGDHLLKKKSNFNFWTTLFPKIMPTFWRTGAPCILKIQWFPSSILILSLSLIRCRHSSCALITKSINKQNHKLERLSCKARIVKTNQIKMKRR